MYHYHANKVNVVDVRKKCPTEINTLMPPCADDLCHRGHVPPAPLCHDACKECTQKEEQQIKNSSAMPRGHCTELVFLPMVFRLRERSVDMTKVEGVQE